MQPTKGLLEAEHKKIIDIFPEVRVRYLSQEVVERYDPEHRSFFNINSPDELAEARAIIEESQG